MTRRERRRALSKKNLKPENEKEVVIEQKNETQNSLIGIGRETNAMTRMEMDQRSVAKENMDYFEDESRVGKDGSLSNPESITSFDDDDSKNLTHTINAGTWSAGSSLLTYDLSDKQSRHDTFNLPRFGSDSDRPIPAPRKRLSLASKESGRQSSDTDKDATEIDIEEATIEDHRESEKIQENTQEVPKPKPRILSAKSMMGAFSPQKKRSSILRWRSLEEVGIGLSSPRSVKSNPEAKINLDVEEQNSKKSGRFSAFLQHRKPAKTLSSIIKLERTRIPNISSILKGDKEEALKEKSEEFDKTDYQLDLSQFPHSELNDEMYVQCRNGFLVKRREDIFNPNKKLSGTEETGRMKDSMTWSMVKTATLFQKYWSRSMMYFHGLLAGFGFGHAFTVTALLFYFNHESGGFVDIYACLALKIHFIFYFLTALCIVSCLDRLDVGNMKKKHWGMLCFKCPSLWLILFVYFFSFTLTFINHSTVLRFDSHRYDNETGKKFWDPEVYSDVPAILSCWCRVTWARDIMVLAAWLFISLTEYPDNLRFYVIHLANKVNKSNKPHNEVLTIIS